MTTDIQSPDSYLAALRAELAGSDPAMVQDALADAEEFVRAEREGLATAGSEPDDEALAARLVERFGSPREVAEAYRETEARVARALAVRPRVEPPRPAAAPVAATAATAGVAAPEPPREIGEVLFGVVLDPRAWGSLFYMFLALGTGIVYFTWAVTGLALSLGLAILIIGVPFTLAFLASVRGFSLLEGRIVETLLGERMPRRAPASGAEGGFGQRVLHWLRDGRTWSTLGYMVLQLPLGVLYFTLFTIILAMTFGLMAAPFAQLFGGVPIIHIGSFRFDLPLWAFPLFWLAAAIDGLIALHLARAIGRAHGKLAKALLVSRA